MLILKLDRKGVIGDDVRHLKIVIKDGFDGAGSQPEIRSRDVKDYFDAGKRLTHLELVGYVPLKLVDVTPGKVSAIFPTFRIQGSIL